MSSLLADFDELMSRLRQGRDLGHTSFEPIYYLVFSPHEILEVKRTMPAWRAKLRNEGWDVNELSLASTVADILVQAPPRRIWLTADRKAPHDWQRTTKSLANWLTNGSLQVRFEELFSRLEGQPNAIVLVTDLEALHPYLRIGAIEGQLAGKFHVPTIFFYPGEREGKTALKFLSFYPPDGNYRSVHVGG